MFKTILIIAMSSIALLACSIYLAANADAGERGKGRKAFQECRAKLGLPERKEGEERAKLSDEQRSQMKACLEAAGMKPGEHKGKGKGKRGEFRGQMKACLEASGVKMPERKEGERPKLDDAQKAAFDKCREEMRAKRKANKGAEEKEE